ncbi:type VII secretion protein EccE [Nocardia sp. CDC159]|uniref:Type VII secretion protein EccE n=1 Tax=Nocardia pulmonis TaxID=2951408 RepID=A0A9X2ED79_9NOCA|nr:MULTISPECIES: type VII secretion protein EccE [Nocardia]MCM6776098.1 type VII secretion protein EccE [Nocardia pulmonis]MCM6788575.1 type VII secretion protein EccE [Nocardia sp. CDC159]
MVEEAIVYTGPLSGSSNSGAQPPPPGENGHRALRSRPALSDQDFWLFRDFPLHLVVPVALLAAVATWVALVFDLPIAAVAAIGAVVLVLGLAPVRRKAPRSCAGMVAGALAFRWYRMRQSSITEGSEPFDVPLPEGGSYGVRWDGDRVITVLRIEPPPDTMTFLRPGSLGTERMLPLTEIARCLTQFDITLASIDIVSIGARTASNGAVAQLYDRILGPLPAIARRTVWLVLRLDPLANAEAVDNRGGGGAGALRTAIIATRRVANRLAARDITVSVLTAGEINSAVRQITSGIALDRITETPNSVQDDGLHLTSYSIGKELLTPRGFAELWATPSLATAITLRLRPVPPRPGGRDDRSPAIALTAVARFDTLADAEEPPVAGLRPLPGQQLRALLDTLPIGTPSQGQADEHRGLLDALADITIPTAGCGQLIGADLSGQGIAVPLIGEGTRHLEVIGALDLAQQVVLRAVALGAHTVVHTVRPEAWHSMVGGVAAPHALSLAPRSAGASHHPPTPVVQPGAPYPPTTVVVFDGIAPTSLAGGATIIYVHDPHETAGPFDADVTLVQDPSSPNLITVRTPAASATVHMVTTPDEMRYIGESLAASR